jgi:hypothetical protein
MSESGLEWLNTSRSLGSRRQWSPFSLSICAQLTRAAFLMAGLQLKPKTFGRN